MIAKHPITPKIFQVVSMAVELLQHNKLEYFQLKFTDDKSCKGKCSHDTIYINYNYALHSDFEDIEDTILHEIAHAIAGVENGHNSYWRDIAADLGVKNTDRYKQ